MISVTGKSKEVNGSQELTSAFRNAQPNKTIANTSVKVKESVNHKNTVTMRGRAVCIQLRFSELQGMQD
jgi:hypothetical protein